MGPNDGELAPWHRVVSDCPQSVRRGEALNTSAHLSLGVIDRASPLSRWALVKGITVWKSGFFTMTSSQFTSPKK